MVAKISFTGDLMSYLPQNKVSFKNGVYDYTPVFAKVCSLLQKSDFVIGNLETPIAGARLGYTKEETVFNTPIEFVKAMKNAGISIVSLANNHCLDRGLEGLRNTVKNVKECGVDTFGCYLTKQESLEPFILDVEGCRIALLGYTYGTNSKWQNNKLDPEVDYSVDLFREQDDYIPHKEMRLLKVIKKVTKAIIPHFLDEKIRNTVVLDGVKTALASEGDIRFINRMNSKIRNAKEKSDFVVMCMHSGGQFNNTIGEYTKDLVDRIMRTGCDVIIGNHPHDILGYKKLGGRLVTYSLGNFCYTPKYSDYINEVLSEYSILLHLYIDTEIKKIIRTTVSLLKTVKQADGNSVVYPVHELINAIDCKNKKVLLKESAKALERFGISLKSQELIPEEIEF